MGLRARRWIRILGETVLVAVVVGVAMAFAMPRPAIEPAIQWTAGSGVPPPQDFRVLMFPARAGIAYAAPDGTTAALDRAMANTLAELEQESITLRLPGGRSGLVARADLGLIPPPDAEPLFEAWKRAWAERNSDARPAQTWVRTETAGGSTEVLLQISTAGETVRWRYRTDGVHVEPLELAFLNTKAAAFAAVDRDITLALKVAAVAAIAGTGWLVIRILARRRGRPLPAAA